MADFVQHEIDGDRVSLTFQAMPGDKLSRAQIDVLVHNLLSVAETTGERIKAGTWQLVVQDNRSITLTEEGIF